MLIVVFSYCYVESRYAECSYAECSYVECYYAECRYADCSYVECSYAECRYAECRRYVPILSQAKYCHLGHNITISKTYTCNKVSSTF
jgi:hypothetical protein